MIVLKEAILSLVVIGILLAIGLMVLGEVKTNLTANSAEYNATGDVIDAIGEIPGWLPILVLVIIASVLLLYVGAFGRTGV